MVNKLALALLSATALADNWSDATSKLVPGFRVEIEHHGKLERGIYSLSNANEIVISTQKQGFLSIPHAEVDRIVQMGTDRIDLGYFANARDQLFPDAHLVYEPTAGSQPPPPPRERKHHWWSRK